MFPGVKVVFRVGLVLVRVCLGTADKLSASPGMYETLEKLRKLPPDIDESFIVREVRIAYMLDCFFLFSLICS